MEATLRDTSDRGYEVIVAADTCAIGAPAMHDASLKAMQVLAKIFR